MVSFQSLISLFLFVLLVSKDGFNVVCKVHLSQFHTKRRQTKGELSECLECSIGGVSLPLKCLLCKRFHPPPLNPKFDCEVIDDVMQRISALSFIALDL